MDCLCRTLRMITGMISVPVRDQAPSLSVGGGFAAALEQNATDLLTTLGEKAIRREFISPVEYTLLDNALEDHIEGGDAIFPDMIPDYMVIKSPEFIIRRIFDHIMDKCQDRSIRSDIFCEERMLAHREVFNVCSGV